MRSLVPGTVLLAACTESYPAEERRLADLELTAHVDVDVSGTPAAGRGVSVFIDYVASACYTLPAATADIDGVAPTMTTGGFAPGESGEEVCTKPAIYLDATPSPRDTSTITVRDDSATYSIAVARLFVNPRLVLAPTLAVGPQIVRVDDPRAIASATIWFRGEDGASSWMKPADTTVHGELRFVIPPESRGRGTLGVVLTIRDHEVTCVGFVACTATSRGGGTFAVTIP